jgi:hypothetical protein
MLVFAITSAVAGILLGLRFKVLVLIPAFLVTTLVIIAIGSDHTISAIVLTVLGTLVSLQIGYIVGSLVRAFARAHLRAAPRHQRLRFALRRFFED